MREVGRESSSFGSMQLFSEILRCDPVGKRILLSKKAVTLGPLGMVDPCFSLSPSLGLDYTLYTIVV